MYAQPPLVVIPARLPGQNDADPRVVGANRIFHDIVELVRANGMEPVIVDDPQAPLDGVGGIVLPGGGDVDPARYDGDLGAKVYDVSEPQDDLDFTIARRALAKGLPIYGICRGAQVLNVVYGGTLHEDMAPSSVQHNLHGGSPDGGIFIAHEVRVEPGALLAETLDEERPVIQSAHHQAVRDLGAGLTATAWAEDGLIEAFEDRERWVIGVQWHPEGETAAGSVRDGQFLALAAEIERRTALPLAG